MPVACVVGLQWGDEGKGKIVDLLAHDAELVVRFQGGANAGHTVKVGDELFVLHLVPSGILHPGKTCVISNGVVLDPVVFLEEIEALESRGIDTRGRLFVSERAHLVLPHHHALDVCREKAAKKPIGTTGRGIGPAYADKVNRIGIRAGEVRNVERFAERVRENTEAANRLLTRIYDAEPLDVGAVVDASVEAGRALAPSVTDTLTMLQDAVDRGRNVFLEGAQGVHLDIDHGTYPFVTSSSASVHGVGPGTGLPHGVIDEVLGVAKAYSTRVGEGPFPSELHDEVGERLRAAGHEFGSTTGRPRRCGWFDVVSVRYGTRLMGVTGLVLTKLDTLAGFERLEVVVAYRRPDGETTTTFPTAIEDFETLTPVTETLPGFTEDVSGVRRIADLPRTARDYLDFIEARVETPIRIVSVGKERDQIIRV